MSSVNKKIRRMLYKAQDGRCFWCDEFLDMLPDGGTGTGDHAATIEHLHSKGDSRRGQYVGQRTKVLACFKCNNERGNLTLEEMVERTEFKSPYHRKLVCDFVSKISLH